jgi:hypothetical protein
MFSPRLGDVAHARRSVDEALGHARVGVAEREGAMAALANAAKKRERTQARRHMLSKGVRPICLAVHGLREDLREDLSGSVPAHGSSMERCRLGPPSAENPVYVFLIPASPPMDVYVMPVQHAACRHSISRYRKSRAAGYAVAEAAIRSTSALPLQRADGDSDAPQGRCPFLGLPAYTACTEQSARLGPPSAENPVYVCLIPASPPMGAYVCNACTACSM